MEYVGNRVPESMVVDKHGNKFVLHETERTGACEGWCKTKICEEFSRAKGCFFSKILRCKKRKGRVLKNSNR